MTDTPHATGPERTGGRRRRRAADDGGHGPTMRHLITGPADDADGTPGRHAAPGAAGATEAETPHAQAVVTPRPGEGPDTGLTANATAAGAGAAATEGADDAPVIDGEVVDEPTWADAIADAYDEGAYEGDDTYDDYTGAFAADDAYDEGVYDDVLSPYEAAGVDDPTNTSVIPVADDDHDLPDDFMGELLDGEHDEYCIVAENLTVNGSEGPVYGPIDVAVPADGLTVLAGRGGSGRTALALTFAGRMKPSAGRLRVLGMAKRRWIRRHVAIAGVDQLDEMERDLTLKATLREYRYWCGTNLWFPKKIDEEFLEELAGDIYGPRSLPPLDAYISQLPSLDRHLLRIAMALKPAHGTEQRMLIVDDLEQVHELDERLWLLSRLVELSRRMPVVVNAVNPLPESLVPAHRQLRLDADAGHINPAHGGYDRYTRRIHGDAAVAILKEARQ